MTSCVVCTNPTTTLLRKVPGYGTKRLQLLLVIMYYSWIVLKKYFFWKNVRCKNFFVERVKQVFEVRHWEWWGRGGRGDHLLTGLWRGGCHGLPPATQHHIDWGPLRSRGNWTVCQSYSHSHLEVRRRQDGQGGGQQRHRTHMDQIGSQTAGQRPEASAHDTGSHLREHFIIFVMQRRSVSQWPSPLCPWEISI